MPMFGKRPILNAKQRVARAQKRRAVARAELRGAVLGILITIGPLAAGFAVCSHYGIELPEFAGVYAVAAAGAVGAVTYGISTAMNYSPPRTHDVKSVRAGPPPVVSRPFTSRLDRFLAEDVASSSDPPTYRSRMAFFLAHLPGRRFAPKSAAAIREILWRIHRLLHRGL